jgi:translation elongation factor EF-Tu-like GTPase
MALTGKTILTLLGKNQKLTFTFANDDIKKGLEVTIDANANLNVKKITKTKITKILKSTDKYLKVAQIDLDTPLNLPVGSFVNIQVTSKKLTGLALPINTILHKNDGNYVVIYENDVFKFKKINILAQSEDYIVIGENISQKIALASESKLAILPSSNNYKIVEK